MRTKLIYLLLGAAVIIVALVVFYNADSPMPFSNMGNGEGDTEVSEISWEQAVAYIEECEADMVFQTHALDVYVTLKNGSRTHTKEPAIDDVFRVLDRTREACGTIPVATE